MSAYGRFRNCPLLKKLLSSKFCEIGELQAFP
jgi:hypothetical protein